MNLDIFIEKIDYSSYFTNLLTLSATLLGLLIATSTFILQSGFSSFEYSRSMFLKYYVRLTKFLFLLLGYNIFLSVNYMYLNCSNLTGFYIHLIFSVMFIKYFLDFYSHKGYIYTLNSSKFNRKKSKLGKYLKYIFNLGLIQILIILILLCIMVVYPLTIDCFGNFTERQGFISTVIAFIFCVVSLIRILPQFFNFSEQEYKQKENNELVKNIESDITQELAILKDLLIKNGRDELKSQIPLEGIDGEIQVNLSEKKDEAFFVINIWIHSSDNEAITRKIESYSYNFFKELSDTNVDINSFVLSYFLRIDGVDSPKTYFIRSKRPELEEVYRKTSEPVEFVKLIKNKVIDDLLRGV